MLKKFRAILLLIISIFLVACSQEETMTSTKPPLLVGMEAGYPPYNWTQSNNSNDASTLLYNGLESYPEYPIWN